MVSFAIAKSIGYSASVTLSNAVRAVRHQFRHVNLSAAGIPATVPIHTRENGWPTSPTRSYERQAEVLEAVVRTVYMARETFNIQCYEFFNLRDADSSQDGIFYQFGLLRDDYSPKPAYTVFRKLIAELSV